MAPEASAEKKGWHLMALFDFLRAKKRVSGDLVFKDNASAFEYPCKYMDCRIVEGETLPALVDKVESLPGGRQSCALRIVRDDGGRKVLLCETLNEEVPILQIGDLFAYGIVWHFPESRSTIAALSVNGFIVAKLEPAWSIEHNGWRVWKRYTGPVKRLWAGA